MPKVPNTIDIIAGSRLKMRRQMLGISQTVLASHLGITFQQIQKYETGRNRVSASRLQQIASMLQVPVSDFFDETAAAKSPQADDLSNARRDISGLLGTREALALNKAFVQISDPDVRRQVIALVEAVSEG